MSLRGVILLLALLGLSHATVHKPITYNLRAEQAKAYIKANAALSLITHNLLESYLKLAEQTACDSITPCAPDRFCDYSGVTGGVFGICKPAPVSLVQPKVVKVVGNVGVNTDLEKVNPITSAARPLMKPCDPRDIMCEPFPFNAAHPITTAARPLIKDCDPRDFSCSEPFPFNAAHPITSAARSLIKDCDPRDFSCSEPFPFNAAHPITSAARPLMKPCDPRDMLCEPFPFEAMHSVLSTARPLIEDSASVEAVIGEIKYAIADCEPNDKRCTDMKMFIQNAARAILYCEPEDYSCKQFKASALEIAKEMKADCDRNDIECLNYNTVIARLRRGIQDCQPKDIRCQAFKNLVFQVNRAVQSCRPDDYKCFYFKKATLKRLDDVKKQLTVVGQKNNDILGSLAAESKCLRTKDCPGNDLCMAGKCRRVKNYEALRKAFE